MKTGREMGLKMDEQGSSCEKLFAIIRQLRDPEKGCPWDVRQTPATIRKYLLEESRELAEAIDSGDARHICEELGDLYFILAMLTTMYEEQGAFSFRDVCRSISDKMIRRHPHVFEGAPVGSLKEMEEQWEAIKAREKEEQGGNRTGAAVGADETGKIRS